ncbi:hypothetical protein QNN00_19375 [Bacillus velezensis]|nr:hypothetical protein [Bacillus velezensis]
MSVDQDCSSEMVAMFGSSLALCVSDIPFEGPIAGVTVGRIDGKFVINPTVDQLEKVISTSSLQAQRRHQHGGSRSG